jgi:TonB-dependent SusC/RagA subfamily outer membrane receptor
VFFVSLTLLLFIGATRGGLAKTGVVKGIVSDKQTREALIGASILLTPRQTAGANEYVYAFEDVRVTLPVVNGDDSQPQRAGAVALKDGMFEMKNVRPGNYLLTVRSVGYKNVVKALTVAADQTLTLEVQMMQDIQGVDAVVVTGVASRRQKNVSETAIGRIDAATLVENVNFSDPAQMLIGKISGINIAPSSGAVGAGVRISVRSNAGLLGGQPVIFLDGTRLLSVDYYKVFDVDEISPLINVSPDDIETIEVLKGPTSSCLYGTSGQNGVVLITTKRGRNTGAFLAANPNATSQEPTFHYQYSIGWQEPSRLYTEDMALNYELVNRVLRRAPLQQHYLSLSGSLGAINYYASMEYRNEQGTLPKNGMERISGRVNLDIVAAKGLTAKISSAIIYNNTDAAFTADGSGQFYSWIRNTLTANSILNRQFSSADSIAIASIDNTLTIDQFIGSAELLYTPVFLEGLRLRALIGTENNRSRFLTYAPPGASPFLGGGARSIRNSSARRFNLDLNAAYSREIIEGWTINAIVGAQAFDNYFGLDIANSSNFLTPLVQAVQSGQGLVSTEFASNFREAGVFGRIETNYLQTYFLSFGVRNDFASTLSSDVPSILYPQASGAVRLDKTGLLPEALNLFKLRAAYAESGHLPTLTQSSRTWTLYYGGGSSLTGPAINQLYLDNAGNSAIRPERIQEFEVGIDVEVNNTFGGEFTYFIQNSRDAIVDVQTPASIGLGQVPQNIGGINGWGFESQIYGKLISTANCDVQLSAILNYSDNRVLNIGKNSFSAFGKPLNTNYILPGFRRGEFMDFVPLRPNFLANGYYDWQKGPVLDSVRTALGSTVPLYTGSFSATVHFLHDFTFYALIDAGLGKNMVNLTRQENVLVGNNKRFNQLLTVLGLAKGQVADLGLELPIVSGVTVLSPNSEGYRAAAAEFMRLDPRYGIVANYLERADWLRLREVSLRWNVRPTLALLIPDFVSAFRELTLGVSFRNLALWTNYSGIDTEYNSPGTVPSEAQAQSTDRWALVQPRVVQFTLNIGF